MKNRTPHQKYLLKRTQKKIIIISVQIGLLLLFLGLWELFAVCGVIDVFIFSCPSRILKIWALYLVSGELFTHMGVTVLECVAGFTIATAAGTFIAIALWWSPFLRKVLEPYVVVLNSLPKVALGPILIIWVGSGTPAIISMAVLICVIITIISVLAGFMEVDADKILLLRAMGANRFQILTKLILPASLPNLISVLKINVGLSWVGTIMGEYLSSKAGLGWLIVQGSNLFKMDQVMASTVLLCILAGLMYLVVSLAERAVKKNRY